MSPQQYERIQQIFHSALELSVSERAAFLSNVCGGDAELQGEVARLIAGHEQAGSFLNAPVAAVAAEMLVGAPDASILGREIGHYRIVSRIGAGGMGEVFLAEDLILGRRVAIKLLPAEFTANADRLRRFEREAKAASALNHPNIITIHEIGKADGLHFIATEFIEGETLRERIGNGPMPIVESLDVAVQIAAALAAAHEAGIVHRDIKPENVMLRPDGYVKVLDFGLAKLTQAQARENPVDADTETVANTETQTGLIIGTPAYMSPEQARAQKVDARADVWSLGVILYEMLISARPFTGQSSSDVLVSILERNPEPLAARRPRIPHDLDRIVAKALAKNVDDRYPAIQQFSHELKELKHRLELEAELQYTPPPDLHELKTVEQRSPETVVRARPKAEAQTSEPLVPVRKRWPRRPSWIAASIIAFALVAAIAIWFWRNASRVTPAQVPVLTVSTESEKQLTWWLSVQKMIGGQVDGAPYQSAGSNDFANGWGFQFNLVGPQSGYLYLINEWPGDQGEARYNLLFPTPGQKSGSAAIAANTLVQTGMNYFEKAGGTEKFWIVWSENPVMEIESVKKTAKPEINDATQITKFLNAHPPNAQSTPDDDKEITVVKWRGGVMVSLVKLKHR